MTVEEGNQLTQSTGLIEGIMQRILGPNQLEIQTNKPFDMRNAESWVGSGTLITFGGFSAYRVTRQIDGCDYDGCGYGHFLAERAPLLQILIGNPVLVNEDNKFTITHKPYDRTPLY